MSANAPSNTKLNQNIGSVNSARINRPMLAPLILVESATYGQTREGIDDRLQLVQRELSDLFAIQNRKDMGMPLSRDENKRLMGLRSLIADLE